MNGWINVRQAGRAQHLAGPYHPQYNPEHQGQSSLAFDPGALSGARFWHLARQQHERALPRQPGLNEGAPAFPGTQPSYPGRVLEGGITLTASIC